MSLRTLVMLRRRNKLAIGAPREYRGAAVGEGKELLRKRWNDLQTAPAGLTRSALARWKRNRGYKLEELLIELARMEGLDAEHGYQIDGEQIDGFFVVDHRHFLLEVKWHELPIPASAVFAFQGKLRGKLLGTLGLFVSIGEFAPKLRSALVAGKGVDVLLVNRRDIELALDPAHTFQEMVRVKMRSAAQTGEVYYWYQRWLDANR